MPRYRLCDVVLIMVIAMSAAACVAQSQSTNDYVADTHLTARVKAALVAVDPTEARDVEVLTYRSVVQLSGVVDDTRRRTEIERITERVAGVVRVQNRLSWR